MERKTEIQKYQPTRIGIARDPHDETLFEPDIPVQKFELRTIPIDWLEAGEAAAWVRIE